MQFTTVAVALELSGSLSGKVVCAIAGSEAGQRRTRSAAAFRWMRIMMVRVRSRSDRGAGAEDRARCGNDDSRVEPDGVKSAILTPSSKTGNPLCGRGPA